LAFVVSRLILLKKVLEEAQDESFYALKVFFGKNLAGEFQGVQPKN
jgi:hypothetical protein